MFNDWVVDGKAAKLAEIYVKSTLAVADVNATLEVADTAKLAEIYVKFTLAVADVNEVDEGILDDVAGVQSKDVLPLTTRVTSNVFPPLLK